METKVPLGKEADIARCGGYGPKLGSLGHRFENRFFAVTHGRSFFSVACRLRPGLPNPSLLFRAMLSLLLVVVSCRSTRAHDLPCTCDLGIQNHSLVISPDGRTAVASSSQSGHITIYDLENKKVRGGLNHFITPRNILFEPTGRFFYVSDSTLGVVEKIDTASLKTVSVFQANPGAFGLKSCDSAKTFAAINTIRIGSSWPSRT